jgi:hypothetical protein
MDFGEALRAAKDGKRIARLTWRRKRAWVVAMPARHVFPRDLIAHPAIYDWAKAMSDDQALLKPVRIDPSMVMKTERGALVFGWFATSTDMLADDWSIVEGD